MGIPCRKEHKKTAQLRKMLRLFRLLYGQGMS